MAYVNNNPMNNIDPTEHDCSSVQDPTARSACERAEAANSNQGTCSDSASLDGTSNYKYVEGAYYYTQPLLLSGNPNDIGNGTFASLGYSGSYPWVNEVGSKSGLLFVTVLMNMAIPFLPKQQSQSNDLHAMFSYGVDPTELPDPNNPGSYGTGGSGVNYYGVSVRNDSKSEVFLEIMGMYTDGNRQTTYGGMKGIQPGDTLSVPVGLSTTQSGPSFPWTSQIYVRLVVGPSEDRYRFLNCYVQVP